MPQIEVIKTSASTGGKSGDWARGLNVKVLSVAV
jgi:hypothetical protein